MHTVSILLKESGCGDIREAAKVLATRLRSEPQRSLSGSQREPRPLTLGDLKTIAAGRGIRSYEHNASLGSEGQLRPLPGGGFHVRTARGPGTARARFTVAHEIGHTFFYDLGTAPPKRLADLPSRSTNPSTHQAGAGLEEAFCDAFASELLFPERCARAVLESAARVTDPAGLLVSVERVSAQWGVSVLATLSRLNDTFGLPPDMLAAVFRKRPHAKSGQDPAVRVILSYPKPSRRWFLPTNKRAASIGFTGAAALYRWWEEFPKRVPNRPYRRSGVFSLEVSSGRPTILENCRTAVGSCSESLQLWTKPTPDARWKLTILHTPVVYRFYAVSTEEAYCLAVLSADRSA